MGWDAYFRSGFHPDGASFGSRKEQERKNCHKVHVCDKVGTGHEEEEMSLKGSRSGDRGH